MADRRSNTTDEFRMHVIDVGHGDSILLEGPFGDTMLIDSGRWQNNGEKVLNYLGEHDIDRLDHLVATHYDADHIGGHAAIIEEFGSDNIGIVHAPKMTRDSKKSDTIFEFEESLVENDIVGNELEAGSSDLMLDDVDIDVLNPSPDSESTDRNEDSVVMHCTYGEQDVLLTGDIGHETEARLVEEYPDKLSQVDVTKISHHGSQYSTSEPFLVACETETAIFSHTEGGDDHPHKETLYRTAEGTDTAVSTALHGSTVLEFDGEDTITVQNATSTANFAVMTRYCREHDEDFDTALVEENALDYEDLPHDIPIGVVNDTSNVQLPNEIQKLREDKKELQNEKEDVQSEKGDLQDRYENLQDKYENLQDWAEDHQDKYGDLLDKYEGVLDENADLREQVEELQTTLDDFTETTSSDAEPTEPAETETPAEQVETALTAAETAEDVRQMLEDYPAATERLREVVQTDRDEHVTTISDVQQNKEAYRRAKRAERIHYPLHKRVRSKLPNRFGGTTLPTENVPSPDDIEGPRDREDLHPAVKGPTAAEHREQHLTLTPEYLVEAEEAADSTVETAETADELCQTLRDTPGAHDDFLYAMDTPNAHHAHKPDDEESVGQATTKQREQSTDRSRDKGRD